MRLADAGDTCGMTGHENFELATDGPKMIVVGLDGSRTSWRAASYANGLARRQGSRVTVVYVASPGALARMAGDAAGMMAVMMCVYRVAPGWSLLLAPIWLIMLLMIAMGIGLCTAALSVSYRDVQYILPVFAQILLYASPVAYSVSAVPENLRMYYYINPLTSPLEALRGSILGGAMPAWQGLAWSGVVATGLMAIGMMSFKRMERRFADVI